MGLRHLLRVVVPVTVAALTMGSGLTAAQASSAPGWRIVKVYGASAGNPLLQGVAASGPSDAWVSGTAFQGLVIDHWNGTGWKRLAVPGTFTIQGSGGVNDDVIGAASARDMWTFPAVSNATTTVNYALHWNDGKWQSFKLRGPFAILNTAVFSSSNAWAFGVAPMKNPPGLGYGPPYTLRYNGLAWKRVSMPGTALGVSPLSANDIWAFGPTAKTAGRTIQDMVAMHWNGRSWTTLAVPRYRMSGRQAILQQLIALGRSNLWAVEGLPVNPGSGQPPAPGLILVHWNGHRWSSVIKDALDNGAGGLVADGHGGVWLQAVAARSGVPVFLHYSGGRLSRVREPSRAGFTASGISDAVLIPGTMSLWAVGAIASATGRTGEAAILKYGR